MKEITDPELLKHLNSPDNIDVGNSVKLKEITDPELLKQLNFQGDDLQTTNQKISAQLQQGVDNTSIYQKAKTLATNTLMAGESLAKDYIPSMHPLLKNTRELGIEAGLGALGGIAGAATGPLAPFVAPVSSAAGYELGKNINKIKGG